MKIAVIAVHGVADQQPKDTANTAANLLLHLDPDKERSRYPGFKTHHLRIPLRAVRLAPNSPSPDGSDSEKCQHQFLRGQLEQYKEPDPAATYETIRNEGLRRDGAGADKEVHIYEMYWADLSRLGNSFLTFFVELYQLLFHLCTVGAKTARFAAAQHPGNFFWWAFYRCVQIASHGIRLPVPIINLFVLALVAFAASAQASPVSAPIRNLIIAIACIAAGLGVAYVLRKWVVGGSLWPYVLIIVALLVAWGWVKLQSGLSPAATLWLMRIEIWGILLVLLGKILGAYEKRHPGARIWGVLIGAYTTFLLFTALRQNSDVIVACHVAGSSLLLRIGWVWGIIIITAFLGCVFGCAALVTKSDSRETDRRAVFTANLVTSVTGFLMLVINIALWGFLPKALQFAFGSSKYTVFRTIAEQIDKHLADTTIIPGMATLLILWAIATLWMIWALVPAVRSEVKTPDPETNSSRWIGRSLTTAFRTMRWAGYLAITCFSVLLLIAIFLPRQNSPIPYLTRWDQPKAVEIFRSFSWLILLFIVAPFFLKGAVVKISAGFRQGLDVALDVINYLREHPSNYTIRAQILARYASLLRYVCNWKSPIDGTGYDRIVIFAHSQGTIITVDLLRFLMVEPDPELREFLGPPDPETKTTDADRTGRIRLFTMGCPLRQLYGLRFPHIYDWARHSGERRADNANLPEDRLPDPTRLLSVTQWVNAYRSGDYVGRNLWRSEKDKDVYDPDVIVEDKKGIRREFCIGGGAHVHYWDKTAPRIAAELDELIARP